MSDLHEQPIPTFATSRSVGESLADSPVGSFPHEGIYIGELESYISESFPALISLERPSGLCFLSNSENHTLINYVIQSLVLRTIASLPSGMCKVTLYDGAGQGANLISLARLDPNIKSEKILSVPEELMDHLKKLESHIPYVIQRVLGDKYASENLIAYNEDPESKDEPYHILVLADFPRAITQAHYDKLRNIISNSHKCGIFVIMCIDTTSDDLLDREGKPVYLNLLNDLQVIYENKGRFYFHNSGEDKLLNSFKLTLNPLERSEIEFLQKYINKYKTVPLKRAPEMFLDNVLDKEEWWSRNSGKELVLPFGKGVNQELVSLEITQVSGQNSAVVVGMPGSGKSNFLHTIIWSALINYSPEEIDLYLIDFSGVEFNLFSRFKFPHVRVIAPEVELEYGLSVLEKINKEAMRREELFRENEVGSFEDFRVKRPDVHMPRVLVLIDEFQKFFDNKYSVAAEKSAKLITTIIKEYRKFGINLILATQQIYEYRNSIELGNIANRVIFEWNENDAPVLFKGGTPMVKLQLGECLYNNRAGDSSHNNHTMTFYSKTSVDELSKKLTAYIATKNVSPYESIIFSRNAEVKFSENAAASNIQPSAVPDGVKVYLGEPIEIADTHLCLELRRESASNILVIGGQNSDAAERIAINAGRSILPAHEEGKAFFYHLNFMNKQELIGKPSEIYSAVTENSTYVTGYDEEHLQILEQIKSEIERRRGDMLVKRYHIYLNIYGFQNAYLYKKNGYSQSKYTETLQFILDNGPMNGVFTIMQVDQYNPMKQTGISLSAFNHRILLQMSENDSREVCGNAHLASRIYEESRPSSRNRAYYYNENNNIIKKFKPYSF